ncbi:hypothetical protein Q1695_013554 [Nippostrongylus brasiliensis]|nr:hypothetical protein Q1695_013554 [Nippostrongylus brasiliensis]
MFDANLRRIKGTSEEISTELTIKNHSKIKSKGISVAQKRPTRRIQVLEYEIPSARNDLHNEGVQPMRTSAFRLVEQTNPLGSLYEGFTPMSLMEPSPQPATSSLKRPPGLALLGRHYVCACVADEAAAGAAETR